MAHVLKSLELRFSECDFGLSARRLWENTELGQVNVFGHAISDRKELNDARVFIDVVWFDGDAFSLAGFTLAEFLGHQFPRNWPNSNSVELHAALKSHGVSAFVGCVAAHLDHCSARQAVRNQHHAFLPTAGAFDRFGKPHIFSTLEHKLQSMGKSKASGDQWLKTIENFQKKGLRAEELECAGLIPVLSAWEENDAQCSASELASLCDFKDLRLSVIAVVSDAQRQLRFSAVPDRALKRTKKTPKAQIGQTRGVAGFDPVLGYRIEQVVHQTLWGADSHWQAVTHNGQVIADGLNQTIFPTREVATEVAASHARQHFPKRVALGRFSSYAWTGGESYREWLITLPYYPASYLSGHFKVRNVLAHVRCDVREGADGERVLMLQEVQSDWAQRARRAASTGEAKVDDEVPPPFMKEWPALTMKLIFLHAAHQRLNAVAWTRGAHQVFRYEGLGAAGLTELYDRTLPREVNRMMKPFGGMCETLGVFVPTNFSIRQTEGGYEVYSPEDELLGTALTLDDARQFVPDQGHELLYEVHGVRLPESMREAILSSGFPAWG
jgi:hypothetical protein